MLGRLQWSPVLGTGKTFTVFGEYLLFCMLQWSPVLGTGKTRIILMATGFRRVAAMEPSLRDWENYDTMLIMGHNL